MRVVRCIDLAGALDCARGPCTNYLAKELRGSLPSIEELEKELGGTKKKEE